MSSSSSRSGPPRRDTARCAERLFRSAAPVTRSGWPGPSLYGGALCRLWITSAGIGCSLAGCGAARASIIACTRLLEEGMSMESARVTTTRGAVAALAVGGMLAVAGCSGGSSGGGTASPTSYSVPASSESSSSSGGSSSSAVVSESSAGPSSGTAAGAPGVPEPARQHTEAGARAFVEYYFQLVDDAYQRPTVKTLKSLSAPGCSLCNYYIKDIGSMAESARHYTSSQFSLIIRRTLKVDSNEIHVFLTMNGNKADMVDASGSILESSPSKSVKLVSRISWTPLGWTQIGVDNE
ncbi:DUF6318 family protein [Flexivirga meconopsidis]|uniref:DUF6318 family protein n=1 Tax=Flexivirga meconopsidis TaxID=2977121 RepID=UPI003CC5848B